MSCLMENIGRNRVVVKRAVVVLLLGFTLGSSAAGGSVRVTLNNWSSQVVASMVLGGLLSNMGAQAEYIPSSIDLQLSALEAGELHVQIELREAQHDQRFDRAVIAKRVMLAGHHAAKSREGWWYPSYVGVMCPGLPEWQALRGCAGLFRGQQDGRGARYYAGPKSWGHKDQERFDALNLPFEVTHVNAAGQVLEVLTGFASRRQPLLVFHWSPHWSDIRYPGHFVDLPVKDPSCLADPKWGPNPKAIYDCNGFSEGRISKVVAASFVTTHRCEFELVKRVSFTSHDLATMDDMVTMQKLNPEQAAHAWLRANTERWKKWIPHCAKQR